MRVFLLVLIPGILAAQALHLSPSTTARGKAGSFLIRLDAPSGRGPASLQWDLVIPRQVTVDARDVVSTIFRRYGLEACRHLMEDVAPADPGPEFVVGIDRLVEASGRRPCKTAADIVDDILEAQRGAPSANRGLV